MDPAASLNATDDPDAPKWAVRLEAKVDIVIAGHAAEIKDLKQTDKDHEERIRRLESKSTVSPAALWGGLVAAAGLVIGALQFLPH